MKTWLGRIFARLRWRRVASPYLASLTMPQRIALVNDLEVYGIITQEQAAELRKLARETSP